MVLNKFNAHRAVFPEYAINISEPEPLGTGDLGETRTPPLIPRILLYF